MDWNEREKAEGTPAGRRILDCSGRNAVSPGCWRPRRRASFCLPERRTPLAPIAVLLPSAIATPLPASMRNTAASPTSTRTGARTSACIAVRAPTVQVAASLPTASTSTVPAETNAASAVSRRLDPAVCLPAGGTSADTPAGEGAAPQTGNCATGIRQHALQ